MEINKNYVEKNINNNISNNLNKEIEIKQNDFLETNIGKIVNLAIDVGLRFVLPDLIEDEIINVKNVIMKEGIKEGVNQVVQEGINFGKSAAGIVTGKFENIEQMQNAVKNGGIIDNISKLIENVINKANKKGKLSKANANLIIKGKDIILDNIDANIENLITEQKDIENKLKQSIQKWNKSYKMKDFDDMEIEYKKIKENLEKLVPIENIIKEGRKIENIQTLIKNNGIDFNLSEEQLNLAKLL